MRTFSAEPGGLSLGFVLAGCTPLWAVDSDPACAKTYQINLGNHFMLADAKECDFSSLPVPDILAGGPPCQPHSTAGKRLGSADERDCIPDFIRAVETLKPAWFLMENVPGLLSSCGCPECAGKAVREDHKGRYFASVLERLRALGYRVWWMVLNAADYGVPQFRRRVFVVGNRTGKAFSWPKPTHGDPAEVNQLTLFGAPRKPWITVAEALGFDALFAVVRSPDRSKAHSPVYDTKGRPSRTLTAEPHIMLRLHNHTVQHGTEKTQRPLTPRAGRNPIAPW